MVTICQKCGDIGYSVALIYCKQCQISAEHLYCLDELPNNFNEDVSWACEYCVPRIAKKTTLHKPTSTPSKRSLRSVPTSLSGIRLKKLKSTTSLKVKSEEWAHDSNPCIRPEDVHLSVDMTKFNPLPDNFSSLMIYKNQEDKISVKDRRLICAGEGNFDVVKSSEVAKGESSNATESKHLHHILSQPIWCGCFSINNGHFDTIDGLAAQVSTKACSKVFDVTSLLPTVLCMEMLPRIRLWPKIFDISKPTNEDVALYFFQENQRYDNAFDVLINDMIVQDLAMRAFVENTELLIFSSVELPLESKKFEGRHYLWGVFRGKKALLLDQPKDHILIQQSNMDKSIGEKRNLTKVKSLVKLE